MELIYIVMGYLDGIFQFLRNTSLCFRKLFLAHRQFFECNFIKLQFVFLQSGIAVTTNVIQNLTYDLV